MSKIIIAGTAAVIKSSVKFEDLETIKKYNPKALTLMGGENGKEPIFMMDVCRGGDGCVSASGICFNRPSDDEAKVATLTVDLGNYTGDVKEVVADKFGTALCRLNALEELLPAALEAVKAQRTTIMGAITVM